MTYTNFLVHWTAQKPQAGDIVTHFNPESKRTIYRLVIDVQQETEHGALITTIPISLSRNIIIRSIQRAAIRRALR